ncbi:hypothetical protein JCM8097_007541 [Rhodosporidiobolus ruineniae]
MVGVAMGQPTALSSSLSLDAASLAGQSCAAPLPPSRPVPPPPLKSAARPPPPQLSTPSTSPSRVYRAATTPEQVVSDREAHRAAFAEAKALYSSGLSLSSTSPRSAVLHFRQASTVFAGIPGRKMQERARKGAWMAGMCWGRVGVEAKREGRGEEARCAFEEARALFQYAGDSSKEAMALYQLALVTPDVLAAAEHLKRAAALFADLPSGPDYAHEAMCYAEAAHLFGPTDADAAVFFLKQCLLLYMKLHDLRREGKALYAIAQLAAHELGDRETGRKYYLQAKVVFHRLAASLLSSSQSPSPSSAAADSESKMKRAREAAEDEANAAYQLGKLAVAGRGWVEAVGWFEEASALFHAASLPVDEAWALYRLALVMLKIQTPDLAVDYLAEARRLFAEAATGEKAAEGSCLMRMGEILGETNPALARGCLEEALKLVDPQTERIGRRSTLCLRKLSTRAPLPPSSPSSPSPPPTSSSPAGSPASSASSGSASPNRQRKPVKRKELARKPSQRGRSRLQGVREEAEPPEEGVGAPSSVGAEEDGAGEEKQEGEEEGERERERGTMSRQSNGGEEAWWAMGGGGVGAGASA